MKTMFTAVLFALLSCGPALAQFGGTSADTTYNPTNFNVWRMGHVYIDSTGKIGVGSPTVGNVKAYIRGGLTSDGSGTTAVGLVVSPNVTGADGDRSYLNHALIGSNYGGTITTQGGADTIQTVASLYLSDPNITLSLTDSIVHAATLYIAGAPSEGGKSNSAIYSAAGDVNIQNGDLLLWTSGGAQYPVLDVINPSTSSSARPMIRVGQDTTAALELYRKGNSSVIYINANQTGGRLSLQTEDTDVLFIDDSQRVGIGTTTPTGRLEIDITDTTPLVPTNVVTGTKEIVLKSGDDIKGQFSSLVFNHQGAQNRIASVFAVSESSLHTGMSLGFATRDDAGGNTVERMRLTSDGFLGIGSTDPTSLLFLKNATTANQRIWAHSDAAMGSAGSAWTTYGIKSISAATAPDYSWSVGMDGGASQASLFFGYSPSAWDAPGDNPLMTITPDGRVGIGTTTPGWTLEVNGQGTFASGTTRTLSLDYTSTGGFVWQTFKRGGTEKWWISSDSADDDLEFQDKGGSAGIVLTLQSGTGNVGIGDSTPDGNLDVHDAAGHAVAVFSSAGSEVHLKLDAGGTSDTKIGWDTDLIFYGSSSLSGALGAWLDSGDFGIGDATPDAFLDVYNSTDENIAALFEVAGSNARIHLKDGNTTSASTVGIGANGDTLHFLASGNVAGHATYTGGVGSLEATGWGEFGFGVSHMDDIDTYMFFNTDAVDMVVGGATLLRLVETGTDSVYIGEPDDVVAIKDSHMVFLANDNDVVINAVEVTGDIDALTETGQVLAITGGFPVLYFNDVTTSGGGDNDFTIQVNNDYMTIVDETAAGQAMLHMNGSSVVVHKGSGTIDHHLEVHNGAVYSELDAGEASFTTSSTPAMKQNILPMTPAQVQALRAAYLDSIQVYNYAWRKDALFSPADSAAMAADTAAVDLVLEKEIAKIERQRATRVMRLDSTFAQDRQLVRFDTVGIDTLSIDTLLATRQDTTITEGDTVMTAVQDTTIREQTAARLDTIYADVVSLVRIDTTWAQVPGIVTPVERSLLRQGIKADIQARQREKAHQASQKATVGAAETRVGFMAPEAKIISQIVAPGAARDDEFNSHHILMAQVALVQDLLKRVQDLENRVQMLENP